MQFDPSAPHRARVPLKSELVLCHAKISQRLHIWVQQQIKGQAKLLSKLLDLGGRFAGVYRHHHHPRILLVLVKLLQINHLPAARGTAGCPKIDQQRLAFKIGERVPGRAIPASSKASATRSFTATAALLLRRLSTST